MNKVFFIIFIVLSTLFVMRYFIVGQAVYGDGLNYWSYTHSLYFDHDLDISNQLTHHFSPISNNSLDRPLDVSNTNYIEYRYPPLSSLFWLPPFIFADFFIQLAGSLLDLKHNGFSDLYQISVGLFNVSLISLGLFVLFKSLKKYFRNSVSFLACITILFATNLIYYGSLDVINSHPTSFFLTSLYLHFAEIYIVSKNPKKGYILWLLSGLLAATRTQDVIFVIITISIIIGVNFLNKTIRLGLIKQGILGLVLFSVGFAPQVILWLSAYGSIVENAYASTPGSFNFLTPRLFELLFYTKTGILYYSPVLIVSFFGLILLIKSRDMYKFFFMIVLLQYYLIASWGAWHQGESYGNRMLISSYPFLAFGLAKIIDLIIAKYGLKLLISLIFLFVSLNFIMILYFQIIVQNPTFISGLETKNEDTFYKIFEFIRLK